jgi:perosamine synthetase
MDVEDARKRITPKTKVIMPVHYGGMSCDMDSLLDMAKLRKVFIVEDAAHAFGSSYKGKKIGSFGGLACFSFDPIKTLTCGEGGAVVTNNARLAETLRRKRLLGITKDTWLRYRNKRSWFYEVVTEGYRYHMSNISAAIGLEQFKKFEKFIAKKKEIVREYDKFFKDIDGILLLKRDYNETAPFNYTIRIKKERDRFIQYMEKRGVSVGVQYIPNHLQPFFKKFKTSKLPITEHVWQEMVSLPLYYDLERAEIEKVKDLVKKFMESRVG